jgi:thioredoxin-like negative regulator of GroEL
MPTTITARDLQTLIDHGEPVVVCLHDGSNRCCRTVAGSIARANEERGRDVSVYTIDVTEPDNAGFVESLGIGSLPAVAVFKPDEKPVIISGVVSPTEARGLLGAVAA